LLGDLEGDGKTTICDSEAGVAALLRLQPGQTDVVLVVAQPGAKSLDVARRAIELAPEGTDLLVVANRVRDQADLDAIRSAVGDRELVVIPEDDAITVAEQEGRAPIDVDFEAPAVRALVSLGERLAGNGRGGNGRAA
jgi:CO dehydrogenase maturation factor